MGLGLGALGAVWGSKSVKNRDFWALDGPKMGKNGAKTICLFKQRGPFGPQIDEKPPFFGRFLGFPTNSATALRLVRSASGTFQAARRSSGSAGP